MRYAYHTCNALKLSMVVSYCSRLGVMVLSVGFRVHLRTKMIDKVAETIQNIDTEEGDGVQVRNTHPHALCRVSI